MESLLEQMFEAASDKALLIVGGEQGNGAQVTHRQSILCAEYGTAKTRSGAIACI